MTKVLELRGITKEYPGHRAVDQVSIAVEPGSFFGLLGPSGCGKTTTLRLVAGFEEPTSGDVILKGERVNQRKPYERNVSTVFQSYALFPHLSVFDNVAFGLQRRKTTDIGRRVSDALELVQLKGKESRKPAELSGGERQRAALARSLVLEPDVLLLDEPLSALDPQLRKQVRAELKALQRRTGITFLFVTHDQEEALSLCDGIALMNRGRVEQVGAPEQLYLAPRTRFAAEFLGTVNWINGVGVRPEATRVSRERPLNGVRVVNATVEHAVFLGNCFHVEARASSGEWLVAEVPRLQGSYAAGERVHLWWQPQDEMVLPA